MKSRDGSYILILTLITLFLDGYSSSKIRTDLTGNPDDPRCTCPEDVKPICGTDGVTYKNRCYLQCYGNHSIYKTWKAYDGACRESDIGRLGKTCHSCPNEINPVCGADGVTYMSLCLFKCLTADKYQRSFIKHMGACRENNSLSFSSDDDCLSLCPVVIVPVCGSDGTTYLNKCLLKCQTKHKKNPPIVNHLGPCEAREHCSCSIEYDPVCGSDGITYRNKCYLECENIIRNPNLWKMSDGKCYKKIGNNLIVQETQSVDLCNCPTYYFPVCGSDGETYQNDCFLQCMRFFKDHTLWKVINGECVNKESKSVSPKRIEATIECLCKNEYLPICASNGKTYNNTCMFSCFHTFYPEVTKVYDGECANDAQGSLSGVEVKAVYVCNCTNEIIPQCAYDGRDYSLYKNPCFFKCAQHFAPRLQPIDFKYCWYTVAENAMERRRQIGDICICPKKYQPICGSDGEKHITYQNYCTFQCIKLKYPKLQVVHIGECITRIDRGFIETRVPRKKPQPHKSPCNCPELFKLICGTDGETYRNVCFLQCQKMYHQYDLQIDYNGRCQNLKGVSQPDNEIEYDPPPPLGCACPSEFFPVCGSDGVSYHNRCQFDCQKKQYNPIIWLAYIGRCRGNKPKLSLQQNMDYSCNCTATYYNPVCGSDGRTYLNECYFGCQQQLHSRLWKFHDGECFFTHTFANVLIPKVEANEVCVDCSSVFKPVCGSDGRTYLNECFFKCVQFFNRVLWKLHDGKCILNHKIKNTLQLGQERQLNELEDRKSGCKCPVENNPVCGSDGNTYKNMCFLECEQFFKPEVLFKRYDGACKGKDPRPSNDINSSEAEDNTVPIDPGCDCPKICRPVCANDKRTYINECQLRCRARKSSKYLYKLYDGYC